MIQNLGVWESQRPMFEEAKRRRSSPNLNGQLGAISAVQGRVKRAIYLAAARNLPLNSGAENLVPLRDEFFNKLGDAGGFKDGDAGETKNQILNHVGY